MQRTELQNYTKNEQHWGKNNQTILKHFFAYLNICKDQQHIFKYMEEKAICTFMLQYWLRKADYYFQLGDYQNCFICLEEGSSRQQDQQNGQNQRQNKIGNGAIIQNAISEMKEKIKTQMKKFPTKGRRSVQQFIILSNNPQKKDEIFLYDKIIKIYNTKYGNLRLEQRLSNMKAKQSFENSWMFERYNIQSEKNKKIEKQIELEDSNNFCLQTPHNNSKFSKKISKTVDSIQLLKKKNTIEKSIKIIEKRQYCFDGGNTKEIQDFKVQNFEIKIVSEAKKRVTFSQTNEKQKQEKNIPEAGKSIRIDTSILKNSGKPFQDIFSSKSCT